MNVVWKSKIYGKGRGARPREAQNDKGEKRSGKKNLLHVLVCVEGFVIYSGCFKSKKKNKSINSKCLLANLLYIII